MDSVIAVASPAQAIEALFLEDSDRLWRAVAAYAADPDVASEAVAEAYAQALRRGAAIRDPAAWIWRTAFRIAAGSLKARRADDRSSPVPADHVDRYEDPDLVMALRRLPEAQRAAVVLYYYADLPTREIAARLGSNQLAVRANLSRGRRRLHQLLEDHDG